MYSNHNDTDSTSGPIVLFDGVCNLCNGWIRFILKREKNQSYRFASLQSETAKKLLHKNYSSQNLSSIILIDNGTVYQKSDAILRICRNLNYPWNMISILLIVPVVLRNLAYDFIAINRYRWFGKQQQCEVLSPEQKFRFLDL
ncbi:thiol-disulfide oxidoreductase DCC family protein [Aquimarina sp. MMG016]|nr:thiol-disulfide oxidoreductase DCC family protein [Aquimarina sp. MMG016]